MTVVLIMMDGTRPDAIDAAHCPNLQNLLKQSSFSLRALSVMPSFTLPCHMSIFHSVPPTRHGVTTNDWVPMARPLPGLIEQAHAAGLHCASIYNWEPLRNLSQPDTLEFAYFRNGAETISEADHIISEEAARYLSNVKSDFAFVYFGTVDTAGHNYGWMSAEYLEQLEYVDGALGNLLETLPSGTTVLLQSDHGGHDRNHGTDSPEDMTIPWMVSGPNIRRGHEIETDVSLLDTAPTLAKIMGIPAHPKWEGHCIEEIFE
jgi:predicted AlkP superfamily pyrophosphatase or phosphodiesterase